LLPLSLIIFAIEAFSLDVIAMTLLLKMLLMLLILLPPCFQILLLMLLSADMPC